MPMSSIPVSAVALQTPPRKLGRPVSPRAEHTLPSVAVLSRYRRRSPCQILWALLFVAACGDDAGVPDGAPDAGPTEWPPLAPIVRPEHPRPDLQRDTFVNLNTVWEFAYDRSDVGMEERWFDAGHDEVFTDRIQVPYAWESPLSGLVPPHTQPYYVGEALIASTYRGVAWYRLRIPDPLPVDEGLDWWVVFGAVDFRTSVWVNGAHALDHEGGYDPFAVALSPFVPAGERVEIVLRVEDRTELADREQPVGKQGGPWYTRTSGIWQTVYLEERPAAYLASLRVVPQPADGQVIVRPTTNGEPAQVEMEARLDGEVVGRASGMVTGDGNDEIAVPLDSVVLWDTDDPRLYDLDIVTTGSDGVADVVHTYFGMVTVRTDWMPGHSPADTTDPLSQYSAVWVNDRPRYLRCVLDQSYHPDGVYTAPSEERIRADLELARSFGFDCIRLHVKIDEPIKYRLADELGMLVVYDMPSLDIQTNNEEGFAGRANVETMIRRAMERDASHPSIVAWVLFNENWGLMERGSLIEPSTLAESPSLQAWLGELVAMARAIDPTRPVEDNSAGGIVGVYEHFDTDLHSFHQYSDDITSFRESLAAQAAQVFPGSTASYVGGAAQDGAPWLNSEIASFSVVGETEGTQAYCDLFGLMNEMRREPKLVGFVITELTDVEYELNGLVAYDRGEKPDLCARAGVGIADVNTEDFVAFEWLPGQAVATGASIDVPLAVLRWSSATEEAVEVSLAFGEDGPPSTATVTARSFERVPLTLAIDAPTTAGSAFLVATLSGADGSVLSKNRLGVDVVAGM